LAVQKLFVILSISFYKKRLENIFYHTLFNFFYFINWNL